MTSGAPSRHQAPPVRPRIGVSSCLPGEQVRFNGGHSRSRFLTGELGPHVDWVPTCSEMAIGLGTPRETLRLTLELRLVNRSGTADHTPAVAALPLPVGLDGYVVKAKSPTFLGCPNAEMRSRLKTVTAITQCDCRRALPDPKWSACPPTTTPSTRSAGAAAACGQATAHEPSW